MAAAETDRALCATLMAAAEADRALPRRCGVAGVTGAVEGWHAALAPALGTRRGVGRASFQ